MRIPDSLVALLDHGVLEEVVRPLMSGKEAQVYLVISGGEQRVAKVYKDAETRSFKQRVAYTEGRKSRNSRDQRAMGKGSRYGRAQNEAAWRSTEVDMIYRLRDAGVRVPTPHHFIDGVLIMEMVCNAEGLPAPRLGELTFSREAAQALFQQLLTDVVRMLCADVVHGDLSEFNVLMGPTGPVIIDFPQAVHASTNQSARKLLLRDVANLQRFLGRFAPDAPTLPYAQEMWQLYESGTLRADTALTGTFNPGTQATDTEALLRIIEDARYDERRRRESLGLSMQGMAESTATPGGAAGPAGREEASPTSRARPAGRRPEITNQRPAARPNDRTMPRPAAGRAEPNTQRTTPRLNDRTMRTAPAGHAEPTPQRAAAGPSDWNNRRPAGRSGKTDIHARPRPAMQPPSRTIERPGDGRDPSAQAGTRPPAVGQTGRGPGRRNLAAGAALPYPPRAQDQQPSGPRLTGVRAAGVDTSGENLAGGGTPHDDRPTEAAVRRRRRRRPRSSGGPPTP